jgi:hypothetical protein
VQSYAQNTQANNLVRSTVGVSGSSTDIKNKIQIMLCNSIGQSSVIGTFAIGDLNVRQGFIQPNVFAKIIDEKYL